MRARAMAAVLLTAATSFAQQAIPPGPYDGQMVVRVAPATPADLERVLGLVQGAWSCRVGPGELDVQVTPAQRAALQEAGIEHAVMIPDVQALLDEERAQVDAAHRDRDAAWFSTFRNLAEIGARLDHYQAEYPEIASTFVVGQTIQGRQIRGVRITGPDLPGNPRSARPAVVFNSCQHAREWATPMTTMWIADRLIEGYGNDLRLTGLVDLCDVYVVPVVNCDGYEFTWTPNNRLWRKNRRDNGDGTFGVDTNRNWGFGWGGVGASTATNNDTYRGTGPFSEPETAAMRDFMTGLANLRAHIDVHSYSQLILTPWGWSAADCDDRAIFRRVERDMAGVMQSVHGMAYRPGPTYTNIYPASGGALDWVYGDRDALGMSIEVRDTGSYGFVMPASEIIPNAEENFEGAIRLVEYAVMPLIFAEVTPPPASLRTSEPTSVDIAVRASAAVMSGLPVMKWRAAGGDWQTVPMTLVAGSVYSSSLPAAGCGERVEYYFEAATPGMAETYPPEGWASPLVATGAGSSVRWADTMSTDQGWTVGAAGDAATTGLWERADPVANASQPGDDSNDAGNLCWITGATGTTNGANDVDGGATTLTSPVFPATPQSYTRVESTVLSYQRWYSNNTGSNPNNDSMPVSISNDGGQSWVTLEDVTQNAGAWVPVAFRIEDFVTPTANMRLRFVARDLGAGSVVEAGVDDVSVTIVGCPADLDMNGDGNADQDDVAYLINVVGGGDNPTGIDPDFNQDGSVDQDDVAALIDAIGGG
ncbi:MAG: hypothetical protein IT433_10625 [Phycisphaerales bacterium]|nr:hypothetical protein [Phycisphaerales bacterium]